MTASGTARGLVLTVLPCSDGIAGPYMVLARLASATVIGRLRRKPSAVMVSNADCAGLRIRVLTASAAFAPLTSRGRNNFSFSATV